MAKGTIIASSIVAIEGNNHRICLYISVSIFFFALKAKLN